jgi:hypothetical protein
MINAATADLIQRAARTHASHVLMSQDIMSFWKLLDKTAEEQETYLTQDVLLARIVVDQLGPSAAVALANREYPRDVVSDLFEQWSTEWTSNPYEMDYETWETRVERELDDYDRGRFRGMQEIYVQLASNFELAERVAMGFDPDDPVAS